MHADACHAADLKPFQKPIYVDRSDWEGVAGFEGLGNDCLGTRPMNFADEEAQSMRRLLQAWSFRSIALHQDQQLVELAAERAFMGQN